MTAGEDHLRDKTRPARIPPLGPDVAARMAALVQADPPGETTLWTAAAMAQAASISVSSVQRIWRRHGPRPHRVRQFRFSTDPAFAAKLRDGFPSNLFDGGSGGSARRRSTGSCRGALRRRDVTDPCAHSNAGPVADEAGSAHDPHPRRQATRHHDLVCRSGRSGGQGDRPLHAAAPAPGVHPLVETRSRRRFRPVRSSTPSWTTMPSTSTPRSAPGSTATRAGPSTSPRPPPHGSTQSRASSQRSRVLGCGAVPSPASSTCRRRSNATLPSITDAPDLSYGRNPPPTSSQPSADHLNLASESVHYRPTISASSATFHLSLGTLGISC